MNTLSSKTTGHNQAQEQKFSKKLFLALIALTIIAAIIFLVIGQRTDLSIESSSVNEIDPNAATFSSPKEINSPPESESAKTSQIPQKK